MLHSRTRVVKTYGKQKSRVVNVHEDFEEALRETIIARETENLTSVNPNEDDVGLKRSPVKGQRPPLAMKNSQAQITTLESDGSFETGVKTQKPLKGLKKEGNMSGGIKPPAKRTNKAVPPKSLKPTTPTLRDNISIPSPSFSDDTSISTPTESIQSSPSSYITVSSDDSSLSLPAPRKTTTRKAAGKKTFRRRIISISSHESAEVVESLEAGVAEEDEVVLLSEQLSKLDTADVFEKGVTIENSQDPLEALLSFCHQSEPALFTSFLETHNLLPSDNSVEQPIKARPRTGGRRKAPVDEVSQFSYAITKIGEASYSEVYSISLGDGEGKDVVLKVVPLSSPTTKCKQKRSAEEEDEEIFQSAMEDVLRELKVTKLVSEIGAGFVGFHEAFVVQGSYPGSLLDAWDNFEEEKGSESIRPDCLAEEQLYAIILLANGGTDLEHFEFDKKQGWRQAYNVFSQIVEAVALGEEKIGFEHRDLHEGQVLIRQISDSASQSLELQATIVDFGLSRVNDASSDNLYWTSIPEDVYDGVGEQWDVYRRTKSHVEEVGRGDWSGFYPLTNVMWLHHLLRILLFTTDSLRKPKSPALTETLKARDATRRRPVRATTKAKTDNDDTEVSEYACYKYICDLELMLRTSAGFASTTRGKQGGRRGISTDASVIVSTRMLLHWCESNNLA